MLLGCCKKDANMVTSIIANSRIVEGSSLPISKLLLDKARDLCALCIMVNLAVSFASLVYLSVADETSVLKLGPTATQHSKR